MTLLYSRQPSSQPGKTAHLETNIRTDHTPRSTDQALYLQANILQETLRLALFSGRGNVTVRLCKVAGLPIWGNITTRYHTVTLTLVNISPRSLLTPLLSCQENDNLTNWQFYILLNFLKLARHREGRLKVLFNHNSLIFHLVGTFNIRRRRDNIHLSVLVIWSLLWPGLEVRIGQSSVSPQSVQTIKHSFLKLFLISDSKYLPVTDESILIQGQFVRLWHFIIRDCNQQLFSCFTKALEIS